VSGRDDSDRAGLVLSLLATAPVFVWCLHAGDETSRETSRAEDSCGTTRLPPIVDLLIEEDAVSSDLVIAGYTLAGAVGRSNRSLFLSFFPLSSTSGLV
jgi:hypothetical protein